MAELSLQEHLQPSLLDRLRDDHPQATVEAPGERVLTLAQLRRSVQRDIGWLFNTSNLQSRIAGYEEVEASVLNYGLPDLAGLTVSTLDVHELEKTVRRVLERYEPRLLKNSIRVQAGLDPESMSHNSLALTIEADLWATPAPIALILRTVLDFESSEVSVSELSARSR